MSQKPETLLWNRLKEKIPQHWNVTRIENRFGGGVPDVHICAEGISFWVELKTTKTNRINISSHQVAWNFAYSKSGGVSFFLVHPLKGGNLYLFDGSLGRELATHGLAMSGSGLKTGTEPRTAVRCLWSGSGLDELWSRVLEIGRGRVGVGSSEQSGSGPSMGSGRRRVGRHRGHGWLVSGG